MPDPAAFFKIMVLFLSRACGKSGVCSRVGHGSS